MKPENRYHRFVHRSETTTVEERLTRIEREFDELKHQVLDLKPLAKDWRQTVGAIPDDELSRNAEKLGREWREQANKD
jgi:hypothetical protein